MALQSLFVYTIAVPSLILISIPLAVCASLTTMLAFAVLTVRLGIVYIEMAMALVPDYLLSRRPSYPTIHRIPSFRSTTSISNFQLSTVRRRKRTSVSSHGSSPSTPPIPIHPSHSFDLSIPQSIGAERDYEGMGGWRLSDKDRDDDALWTKFNSRLKLPADGGRVTRRHQRALTSEGMSGEQMQWRSVEVTYQPEIMYKTSPHSSRSRTPPNAASAPITGMDGYFSQPVSPKSARRSPPFAGSPVSSRAPGGISLKMR